MRDGINSTGTTYPPGENQCIVRRDGRVSVRDVVYRIGKNRVGEHLHVIAVEATVRFWSIRTDELIAEHRLPEHSVKHVGFVRYNRARTPGVSTMS